VWWSVHRAGRGKEEKAEERKGDRKLNDWKKREGGGKGLRDLIAIRTQKHTARKPSLYLYKHKQKRTDATDD
jgi:hypothetical protein